MAHCSPNKMACENVNEFFACPVVYVKRKNPQLGVTPG